MKSKSESSEIQSWFLQQIALLSFIFILTFFVILNNVFGQEISTLGISLPNQNSEESKVLASLEARVKRGELPFSRLFKNIKPNYSNLLILPPPSAEELRGEENSFLSQPLAKPSRIGIVRKLYPSQDLFSLSRTYTLKEGTVSVMSVNSSGSLMTRLHFVNFDLPEGARVFVYSAKNPDDLYGPYEAQGPVDNKSDFWTPPVEGEEVIIEYFSPKKLPIDDIAPFSIADVSHMFKDPLQNNSPEEGSCHNNVPSQWTDTAKTVGGVDYISAPDQLWCSGTLLTNQSQDLAPFFLTANHCISTDQEAQTVRIWWFYDAAGQTLSSKPHSDVTKLIANKDKVSGSDFALLQILGSLPTGVRWSGWTTSMPGLFSGVVGIHHPAGAYKRISYGDIGTSIDCIGLGITCTNFLPVDWSNIGGGVTEGGSSGSGLWRNNSSNPQLVGQLYGGLASCSNTVSNDYYGRFDLTYAQISSYMNGTWSEFDDNLEQNDSRSNARSVSANVSYGNLKVKYADEDWYKVTVPNGGKVTFSTNFEHDYGDIDIKLYRGSDANPMITSESSSDNELVEHTNTGTTTDYFLQVYLYQGTTYSSTRNTYNMNVSVQGGGGCAISTGQGASGSELTAFQNAYNTGGGQSALGCATSSVTNGFTSFNGTIGHYQTFANGEILYHVNNGQIGRAFAIINPLRAKWASYPFDRNHPLGYPISFVSQDEYSCNNATRHRYQSFESGTLSQHLSGSLSGNVYEVHGAIHRKWEQRGFAGCTLGLPTSDESAARPSPVTNSSGKLNQFQYGQIYWKTNAPEAFEVHGSIYSTYTGMGGSGSWLGFPTSDEFIASTGYARSNFEGGYITWDGATYRAFPNSGCPSPLAISIGQTINGSLQSGDCQRNGKFYDAYTFNGTAGQRINIRLNSTQFDSYLYLYRGNNLNVTPWNSNDDGGGGRNSRIPAYSGNIILPSTGTYTILASSYYTGESGGYMLSLDIGLVATSLGGKAVYDFDSDGSTDYSVFRPSNGNWYSQSSTNGFEALQFGISTDRVVPADYDGDGRTDIAVFRNDTWYLLRSTDGFIGIQFGMLGDIPLPGDYDGDGKADIAVFRPSNGSWYLLRSTQGFTGIQFGITTDKPVPADYDGDGKTDIAVYRDGIWYWSQSSDNAFRGFQWGIPSDKPVIGDYDGDGKADQTVYRNGYWYIYRSRQGFLAQQFGIPNDKPLGGDYDGDGKSDIAVWRPENGTFYVLTTNGNQFYGFQFGQNGDIPIGSAYVP